MAAILGSFSLVCAWAILFYLQHQIKQLKERIGTLEKGNQS